MGRWRGGWDRKLPVHTKERLPGIMDSEVEMSSFFGDSVVACDVFRKTALWEDIFCWSRHAGGYFAENRHMVFFWKLPGKRACDVLLEWTLERTHVWKGFKYNPTHSSWCCGTDLPLTLLLVFFGLCWCWSYLMMLWLWFVLPSLLIIFCNDFVERKAPKNIL